MNIYPFIFALLYIYSFPPLIQKQCANPQSCGDIETCILSKRDTLLTQDAVDEQENLTSFLHKLENKFQEMSCRYNESFDDDTFETIK